MPKSNPERTKTPLRESQKTQRRRAIMDAAKALIAKQGYDGATIEEIASIAGLSRPTVHNYFGTKLDLLMALYAEDRDIALARISRVLSSPPADPVDLMMSILEADFHHEVEVLNRSMWRQIAAAEMVTLEQRHRDLFRRYNEGLIGAVRRAVKHLVRTGALRPDLNANQAADLIAWLIEGLFRRMLMTEDQHFAEIRGEARRYLKTLIAGMAP